MLEEARDAEGVLDKDADTGQLPSSRGSRRPVRKLIHMALALIPAIAWYLSYELALALAARPPGSLPLGGSRAPLVALGQPSAVEASAGDF